MVRIAEIEAGSIAQQLQLEIGSRIVRINGEPVRDGLDFSFLSADLDLELEAVTPSGQKKRFQIQRQGGEALGLVPAPDPVRECANRCVFCFIDGNPHGARPSLFLRDDDFRLSFAYGSYVTLTNLGPKGLKRLVQQRISPLYVSVHATEPEVRQRLLANPRAGLILDQLGFLTAHGLEIHAQAVICPGWNDRTHLDRTMEDLFALGENIRSLSVVPVGLTRYNVNRPVRPLTPEECGYLVEQVERMRLRALSQRGYGWVYAADELFLKAGQPLPEKSYYEPWDLTENGVGAVVRFLETFQVGLEKVPRLRGRRLRILTGHSMEPFLAGLAPRLAASTGARVEVTGVANEYFGELVTVAGLLAGRDLLRAAQNPREEDVFLLPQEALNSEGLFIDSFPVEELKERLAPARVVAAYDITEALQRL